MILNEEKYVDKAKLVIENLAKNRDKYGNVQMVTTSKLRNLLSLTTDIYNDVLLCMNDRLDNSIIERINYLRIRFLYEAGRAANGVGKLVEQAEILDCLAEIQGSRKRFILFNRYMEALIAYHKYYGGKD